MANLRKQVVVDKKFQYSISLKAIILPLFTILLISAVLLYFAAENKRYIDENNNYINDIVATQHNMIDMFLETPALYNSKNPVIKNGSKTFNENIGKLKKIRDKSVIIVKNSQLVFYFLIVMTVVQTSIIFILFIFFSHKISGPVYVMSRYLREIREGKKPHFRPLRKRDELQQFYFELQDTVSHLFEQISHARKDKGGKAVPSRKKASGKKK
jgi:hypothetical protein